MIRYKANIAFGIKKDDVDYAQIMTVLEVAQLDELICSLPNGIETVIGERGVRLVWWSATKNRYSLERYTITLKYWLWMKRQLALDDTDRKSVYECD